MIDRNGKPASSITTLDVFDLDSIAAQRVRRRRPHAAPAGGHLLPGGGRRHARR
ncbi:hypothetical protein [Kribbella sp. VKM Ac-2500]|uniref:hypothetical protein n=1 Tax=Kribbella sp. VKM Ac-2500 TaxID=2512214 RepID=UPI001A7E66CD|nr:hypothetical protein [Kribbella sp. VKM Ac-2500]